MSAKDISVVVIGMNIMHETEKQLKVPLKKLQLSVNEWLVLKSVYLKHSTTPSGVADCLRMQRASVTRHVDNLVEQKMMKRKYQHDDRRTIELSVTNTGEKTCKKIFAIYPQITNNIESRLDGKDKDLWLSMFK